MKKENIQDRCKRKLFEGLGQRQDDRLCWEWSGAVNNHGYGRIRLHDKGRDVSQLAHRASFEHFNGKIPEGGHICHSCDNPRCVNPKHLFLGTAADNVADMIRKGRNCRGEAMSAAVKRGCLRGEAHQNTKLSESDVREIIKLRSEGMTYREIAEAFNVDITTPHKIVKYGYRQTLKHVQLEGGN